MSGRESDTGQTAARLLREAGRHRRRRWRRRRWRGRGRWRRHFSTPGPCGVEVSRHVDIARENVARRISEVRGALKTVSRCSTLNNYGKILIASDGVIASDGAGQTPRGGGVTQGSVAWPPPQALRSNSPPTFPNYCDAHRWRCSAARSVTGRGREAGARTAKLWQRKRIVPNAFLARCRPVARAGAAPGSQQPQRDISAFFARKPRPQEQDAAPPPPWFGPAGISTLAQRVGCSAEEPKKRKVNCIESDDDEPVTAAPQPAAKPPPPKRAPLEPEASASPEKQPAEVPSTPGMRCVCIDATHSRPPAPKKPTSAAPQATPPQPATPQPRFQAYINPKDWEKPAAAASPKTAATKKEEPKPKPPAERKVPESHQRHPAVLSVRRPQRPRRRRRRLQRSRWIQPRSKSRKQTSRSAQHPHTCCTLPMRAKSSRSALHGLALR